MITRLARPVGEAEIAPGRDDENATELPWIPFDTRLSRTFFVGTESVHNEPRRSDLRSAPPESGCAIGREFGVDEECSFDLELLSKRFCKHSVSVANDDDVDSLTLPATDGVTQLRDLLTAENSTEVAQEDQDGGLGLPIGAESDLVAGRAVLEFDRRESIRDSQNEGLPVGMDLDARLRVDSDVCFESPVEAS